MEKVQEPLLKIQEKIYLDGSKATATDKIQSMTGVYVDDGAKFINRGESEQQILMLEEMEK